MGQAVSVALTWRNIRDSDFYLKVPEPVHIGPTWRQAPDWDGKNEGTRYDLPEHTLGWQAVKWVGENLLNDEGQPFVLTAEQTRFILWWYAVDENGRWLYRQGVLQRIKGWGKDPLGAVLIAIEFVGPCRFAGWAAEDMPKLGLLRGDPVAKSNPRAWVQTAAVSLTQTQNTMKIFQTLFTEDCKAEHMIDVGKEIVYAHGGQRTIQAVTSSPTTMEGNRPSFILANEALALDTPVMTPFGWSTVGELEDGDVIHGADGGLTRVEKAHEVQYGRDCFQVTIANGETVTASDGHLWTTRLASSAALPKIRTTEEMVNDGRRFMVPRADPLIHPDAELEVDPYLLGYWLGDGSTGACNLTIGDEDIAATAETLARRGIFLRPLKRNADRCGRYTFSDKIGFGADMGGDQAKALRKLGCFRDKHIPRGYYAASVEQRLDLLRGLMDSDGCHSRTQAIFIGTERLATDVFELASGLGFLPFISRQEDARSRHGATWRVQFKVEGLDPFSMPRKATEDVPARREWVSIKHMRQVESVPVRCLTVNAEDSLFQVGMGMVTHNTHHWLGNNKGRDMAKVIRRNLAKSKGGDARMLAITNAYERGEESVAEVRRTTYEAAMERGRTPEQLGVLYDSVEAPADALLVLPPKRDASGGIERQPTEDEIKAYIGAVIDAVRGDASWLDVERLVGEILDGETTTEESRRFYYNQIGAEEDAWLEPLAIERAVDKAVREHAEASGMSRYDDRWITVQDEPIVMFFDGSKSQDATGLVGCRLSDGHVFTIGVWQRPAGARGNTWRAPREAVDDRVREAMQRFKVQAFWADPSHAKDDEDGSHYWDGIIDGWHQDFRDKFDRSVWAVKSADRTHSIMWDMTSPLRSELFVQAAQRFVEEMERKNDIEEIDPSFTIDGHPLLLSHLKQARRRMTKWGESLGKSGRQSTKKIDLAVCAVGARMLRRVVLNVQPEEAEQASSFWSY